MKNFLYSGIIMLGLSFAMSASAVEYLPIVYLPKVGGSSGLSTEDYIQALYALSITVAGLLAVIRIIFAGVKYVLSDVVTNKGDAIKEIRGALLGLLIVLSAVLILNTINPNLTRLDILGNTPPTGGVAVPSGSSGTATSLVGSERTFSGPQNAEQEKYKKACLDSGGKAEQQGMGGGKGGGFTKVKCVPK